MGGPPVEPVTEAPGTADPVTVLYVGGCGRSGSTLVDRILGAIDGTVAVGELVHLIQRGLIENEACGCGQPFRSCPFWVPVIDSALGAGPSGVDAEGLRSLQARVDRNRYVPRLVLPGLASRSARSGSEDLDAYAALLGRLYQAIAAEAGVRVVVDSSKHASTAFLLRRVPGIDLRVVHLVRDARGMAYSWTKSVARPEARTDRTMMHQHRPTKSAARWVGYNALFEILEAVTDVPTTRVIYEDFVADPRRQLDRILDGAGAGLDLDRRYPFLGEGWVELEPGHSVAGNPMRFSSGRLDLRVDTAWKQHMAAGDRRAVTTLALPLLAAYGFLGRRP